jgi:MFS family permease
LAGWLVTSFGWRSIFWFNVPIGILVMVVVGILLKMDSGQRMHIDFAGAGYLMGAIFGIMIGLSQISKSKPESGWLVVGLLFLAGFIFLGIFIRHELKTKDPIIELVFLRQKAFMASNIYIFIYGLCTFGLSSLLPLFAASVYNMNTLNTSYILTVRSIGMIMATTVSSFLIVRWGYRRPLLIGTVLIAITLILMGIEPQPFSLLGFNISSLLVLCLLGLGTGLGMGIATTASVNAGVDLMPQKASAITGVAGMFRQGGGAIEIAMVTLLLQYLGNMTLGFEIAFIATGVIVLASIPCIFALPARPR